MSGQTYLLAAVADVICAPLLARPSKRLVERMPPDESAASWNIEQLLEGGVTAAFVASLDYARNSSNLLLSPSLAVASAGPTGVLKICIGEGTRSIRSLAVGRVSATDVVLARIILSEQFGQEITIVPRARGIDESLSKADALLVSGDEALLLRWKGPVLDLTEEWFDMTEAPYLHFACVAKESQFTPELETALEETRRESGAAHASSRATGAPRLGLEEDTLDEQLSHLVYGLTDEVRGGINEFFRYAFYLGILPDIPDINLYGGT